MQYKKVKRYLDPNNYLIELNSYSEQLLADNGISIVQLDSFGLYKYLNKYLIQEIQLQPESGCYVFKSHIKLFTLFYNDKTGNEFSNNKIWISAYRKQVRSVMGISLNFLLLLSNKLSTLKDSFYTYWIYNEITEKKLEEFIISFHAIRNDEEWCDNDLDIYCANNRLSGKEAIIRVKTLIE